MGAETKLRVRRELCLGCGLCVESCPQQAISLQAGQAHIDQGRCNHCGLCLDVCPQGAIGELAPVSRGELEALITSLRQKTDELIRRIKHLEAK